MVSATGSNSQRTPRYTPGKSALFIECVGDPPVSMAVLSTAFPVKWSPRTPNPKTLESSEASIALWRFSRRRGRLGAARQAGGEALAVEALLDTFHAGIFCRAPVRVGIDGERLGEPILLGCFLRDLLRVVESRPAPAQR